MTETFSEWQIKSDLPDIWIGLFMRSFVSVRVWTGIACHATINPFWCSCRRQ
jgi:hypothetical protein